MPVELDEVRVRSPRYPEETPYWPCALFLCGEEIVAALFFDDSDGSTGHPVDERGVVQWDEHEGETAEPGGWCLQILYDTSPSPEDPRVRAPDLEVWGVDMPLAEVMETAYEAVCARAQPLGLSYVESQELLLWRPVGGW